jgi:hypothetical protein
MNQEDRMSAPSKKYLVYNLHTVDYKDKSWPQTIKSKNLLVK